MRPVHLSCPPWGPECCRCQKVTRPPCPERASPKYPAYSTSPNTSRKIQKPIAMDPCQETIFERLSWRCQHLAIATLVGNITSANLHGLAERSPSFHVAARHRPRRNRRYEALLEEKPGCTRPVLLVVAIEREKILLTENIDQHISMASLPC